MKRLLPFWGLIMVLTTIIEVFVISNTDSRFLLNYLMFSPLSVFQKNYPHFWWLVYLIVKVHLPIALILSTVIVYNGYGVIINVAKNIDIALWVIVNRVWNIVGVIFFLKRLQFLSTVIVYNGYGVIVNVAKNIDIALRHKGSYIVVIIFITSLSLALRIIYMTHTNNYFNGDTGARFYDSYLWCLHPQVFMGFDWLPFHFYLVGLAIKVTGDVLWAPRLVQVLLGSISIIPFYFLVKKIADKQLAIISIFFLAVFPFHIKMSVVTLTEVPFTFLIICALFFQQEALGEYKNRSRYLFLCALFISCAGFMRMEAWLYAFLIGVVFLIQMPLRQTLLYGCVAGATPLFILLVSWLATGEAFRSINYSDYEVRLWAVENNMTAYKNLKYIPEAFLSASIILIPLGLLVSTFNRKTISYVFVVFIPFFIILYKIVNVTLTGQSRYLFTTSVLLIPFYFAGIRYVFSRLFKNNFHQHMVVLNIGLLCILGNFITHLYEPIVFTDSGLFSKGFIESAFWAKKNIPMHSRIFIDNSNFCSYAWMVYSGSVLCSDLPYGFPKHNLSTIEAKYYPRHIVEAYITGRTWVGEYYKTENLIDELNKHDISHIVIFKGGVLAETLHFDALNEDWAGYHFERVVDFSGNKIYAVNYLKSEAIISRANQSVENFILP